MIALVLVPATVMAAGFGGKITGSAPGQGQCLQDGQNCGNQTGQQGTGSQAQYPFWYNAERCVRSHRGPVFRQWPM